MSIQKVSRYASLLKAALVLLVAVIILGYAIYLIVILYKQLNKPDYVGEQKTKQPESNRQPPGAETGSTKEETTKESPAGGLA